MKKKLKLVNAIIIVLIICVLFLVSIVLLILNINAIHDFELDDVKNIKIIEEVDDELKNIYKDNLLNGEDEYGICLFGKEIENNEFIITKMKKANTINSTRKSTFVFDCENLIQEDKDININRNLGFTHPHYTVNSCLLSEDDLKSLHNAIFERRRLFMGVQCWVDENKNNVFDDTEYKNILYSVKGQEAEVI